MSGQALFLLGSPRIERDGAPVRVDRRKSVALIAYLAMTGESHGRDPLATLLCPEYSQSRARAGLRAALATLTKTLGGSWLEVDRESVGLNPDATYSAADRRPAPERELWLDVSEFRGKLADCRTHDHPEERACPACLVSLTEAAELYRDDFLAGFLLAAHDYIVGHYSPLDRDQSHHLRHEALHGWEIVDSTARLCVMNLYLHGIGANGSQSPIHVADSLATDPGNRFDMVLTNPPFGKKSSVTYVTDEGELRRESPMVVRDDFWTSTSNKQLNFVQHVKTLLRIHGRAAVVVPDNVLFEGGAGETVRRKLLHECEVHTLLRLPTGVFYAQGVKANVLFFDRKPASATPWTKTLWMNDLRTNMHFTLVQDPLTRADLDGFVECYHPENRHQRTPTWSEEDEGGRWRALSYDELLARDKVNLDIFWLRDESLEDTADLPDPDVLAVEIVEDLQAALEQFREIAEDLGE